MKTQGGTHRTRYSFIFLMDFSQNRSHFSHTSMKMSRYVWHLEAKRGIFVDIYDEALVAKEAIKIRMMLLILGRKWCDKDSTNAVPKKNSRNFFLKCSFFHKTSPWKSNRWRWMVVGIAFQNVKIERIKTSLKIH